MKLVLATNNAHKVSELRSLLTDIRVEVLSLADVTSEEIIFDEKANTFHENACIKAEAVRDATGLWSLADDSGLEVYALDGRPGVHSARFSGEHATDSSNNQKLLESMQGLSDRKAQFTCVLALARPGQETLFWEGHTSGKILESLSGTGGFGYDPLFYSDDLHISFAEASIEDKNRVSHRGRAMNAFLRDLPGLLDAVMQ